ncbi:MULTISPECIES: phosphatidate cytidylyltransferase [unclassified Collinsella]|uniref:phosphatidate cytidylyltransferase n=1 Tax=unclassified Collinsella TaxID=2637548 RepID=UPI00319EB576
MERRRAAREDARVIGGLRSQRFRSSAEKFITRSTYGLLYAAIILVCLFWGRVPTMFLVSAMSWLCGSEFYRMARLGGRMPNEFIGLAAAALYPLAALVSVEGQTGVTLLLMLAAGTWYVLTPRASISDAAITVFGAAYTGLLFSSVVVIRASYLGTEGALLTLGVMGSVWVNDATAYIFGSQFGKHKMAPRISPNKSWEGFVGGLLGSCLTWIALYALKVCGIRLLLALIGGLVCGVSGVIGDLFESRLKRAVGVKDSGNLIPGHGGLLDRSDSMLFATMTAYFVLHIGGIL